MLGSLLAWSTFGSVSPSLQKRTHPRRRLCPTVVITPNKLDFRPVGLINVTQEIGFQQLRQRGRECHGGVHWIGWGASF